MNKKEEKEKVINFPKIAYFKDVFYYKGKLNLNLNILSEKEIKEIMK